jgi:hypothetical protein
MSNNHCSSDSLRDIFAVMAMHALILEKGYVDKVCEKAYKIADDMMVERDK